ncbi:MAG: hypothetical protein Q7T48_00485 [Cellvibrio sp.]|uniref:hypothetical protein n=1 Tax=Cellvibrio sp. TaxID=1965322 RepID=UPI002719C0F9|nr:hypothetical protein [Cellvibrio sp.]
MAELLEDDSGEELLSSLLMVDELKALLLTVGVLLVATLVGVGLSEEPPPPPPHAANKAMNPRIEIPVIQR